MSPASYEGSIRNWLETNVHSVSRKLRHGEGGDIGRVPRVMRAQIRNWLETNCIRYLENYVIGRERISQLISAENANTNPRDVSGVVSSSCGTADLTVGLLFRQKNTSWGGYHGL